MPQSTTPDPAPASPGWRRNNCFGCGPGNDSGLRLNFTESPGGQSYICEFQLGEAFGGPPGHAHGGIIATILDEAMSKANRLRQTVALTRRIEVDYLRPVPLGQPLVVEGSIVQVRGRAHYNRAQLRSASGELLAQSRGKFLAIDAEKLFARELQKERKEAERRESDEAQGSPSAPVRDEP
jgi:uncharacterized protein (TIGR00369 family)